ncbi:MAG: hypothetical protein KFH87_00370 [Bacteroidetes bacterium]|nr:hypothetical protein [Bacteroidota bacterium]
MKYRIFFTATLFVFLFSSHLHAQRNAADAQHPALDGYCPVAYVEMNKPMKGDEKISSTYEGHRYVFANKDAKKMFEMDPGKYTPRYDGTCATAMAMGKRMDADPQLFANFNGALYMFSSEEAMQQFGDDPDMIIEQADTHWSSMGE